MSKCRADIISVTSRILFMAGILLFLGALNAAVDTSFGWAVDLAGIAGLVIAAAAAVTLLNNLKRQRSGIKPVKVVRTPPDSIKDIEGVIIKRIEEDSYTVVEIKADGKDG